MDRRNNGKIPFDRRPTEPSEFLLLHQGRQSPSLSSDSGSSDLDERFYAMQPPSYRYEDICDKMVDIYPKDGVNISEETRSQTFYSNDPPIDESSENMDEDFELYSLQKSLKNNKLHEFTSNNVVSIGKSSLQTDMNQLNLFKEEKKKSYAEAVRTVVPDQKEIPKPKSRSKSPTSVVTKLKTKKAKAREIKDLERRDIKVSGSEQTCIHPRSFTSKDFTSSQISLTSDVTEKKIEKVSEILDLSLDSGSSDLDKRIYEMQPPSFRFRDFCDKKVNIYPKDGAKILKETPSQAICPNNTTSAVSKKKKKRAKARNSIDLDLRDMDISSSESTHQTDIYELDLFREEKKKSNAADILTVVPDQKEALGQKSRSNSPTSVVTKLKKKKAVRDAIDLDRNDIKVSSSIQTYIRPRSSTAEDCSDKLVNIYPKWASSQTVSPTSAVTKKKMTKARGTIDLDRSDEVMQTYPNARCFKLTDFCDNMVNIYPKETSSQTSSQNNPTPVVTNMKKKTTKTRDSIDLNRRNAEVGNSRQTSGTKLGEESSKQQKRSASVDQSCECLELPTYEDLLYLIENSLQFTSNDDESIAESTPRTDNNECGLCFYEEIKKSCDEVFVTAMRDHYVFPSKPQSSTSNSDQGFYEGCPPSLKVEDIFDKMLFYPKDIPDQTKQPKNRASVVAKKKRKKKNKRNFK